MRQTIAAALVMSLVPAVAVANTASAPAASHATAPAAHTTTSPPPPPPPPHSTGGSHHPTPPPAPNHKRPAGYYGDGGYVVVPADNIGGPVYLADDTDTDEPADPKAPGPHFVLELGTGVRHFADPLAKQSLGVAGTAQDYTLGGNGGDDSAVTTQLRILGHISHGIYLGAEGELGSIVGTPAAVAVGSQGGMVSGPSSEMLLAAAGIVGGMEQRGNARFGVELATGVRSIEYKFRGLGQDIGQTTSTGVVEPRARAEYWVSPHLALGAMAGTNLLEKGDWMATAYLSLHTHPFAE